MNKNLCFGCGAVIQTSSPKKEGYLPEKALEKAVSEEKQVSCQRCFRLKHYNEFKAVDVDKEEIVKTLDELKTEKGIAVMVIDIFAFSSSLIKDIHTHLHGKKLIVVANKFDLLPRSVNPNKIINYISEQLNKNKIEHLAVTLISATKKSGVKETWDLIDRYRKEENVFILGMTNVGKSTFINAVLQEINGTKDDMITTSYFPKTTLGIIKVPLDNQSFLVDTPGMINETQYTHYFDTQTLKLATPRKEIKPKVYQLNSEQTIFVAGLVRFDFIKGTKNSFIFHFANELELHRTKLENADDLFSRQHGLLLSPPSASNVSNLGEFKARRYTIIDQKVDIVIAGLGWITVNSDEVEVAIHAPSSVSVHVRKSII